MARVFKLASPANVMLVLAAMSVVVVVIPPEGCVKAIWVGGILSVTGIGVFVNSRLEKRASDQREREQKERLFIREELGKFIAKGQVIAERCVHNRQLGNPEKDAHSWSNRTNDFLVLNLGQSYGTRFNNTAGIPFTPTPHASISWLEQFVVQRLRQLDLFSSEIS